YSFASGEPFATLRGEFTGRYGGGQEGGRGTIEQQPAGFKSTTPVPVWTSQLFLNDWWRQAPTPVEVTLTPTEVSVENRLQTGLRLVRLAAEGQLLELGDVAAGEKKVFSR